MEVYSTTDLVSVTSQEISIDVTTAFMKSMKIKETIISCMTDIDTLLGLAFINSSGHNTTSLALCNTKSYTRDLTFVKMRCYLDGSTVDRRISQPGIDLQFCFTLPQSSYDPNTGEI